MNAKLGPVLLFAKTFFKHPLSLGSLLPSSSYLAQHLLDQVEWSATRVVVEYGPGVGTLTDAILRRMRPDGILVALETNGDFVAYMKSAFLDPRLHVFHASAAEVSQVLASLGLEHADVIFSGIPYSTMPAPLRELILQQSRNRLRPGGAFIVYQFTGVVMPHLKRFFEHVHEEFEIRNVLPAKIFCCIREA